MSVAVCGSPVRIYAAAQDNALSGSGAELRTSLEVALEPPRLSRIEMILDRITRALKKGRATEGVLVDVAPFGRMSDLLAVLPNDIPIPEIVVESGNEIGLDWSEGPRRVLTLTIDETPNVGFAALFGQEPLYGRIRFDAGVYPETLSYLFSRLYPSRVERRH